MKKPAIGQHVRFTTKATEYSTSKTLTGTYDECLVFADSKPRFRAYAMNGGTLKSGKPALSGTCYTLENITDWKAI